MKQERNEQADLKKLADAFYSELHFSDRCEYGSIGIDCKRPFGNSDVERDILKIIGWSPNGDDGDEICYSSEQLDYARKLYSELLVPFLKEQWRIYISEIKPWTYDTQEQAVVPLALLKTVLEAATDNHLECMNDHLAKNEGYMHTIKNKALLKIYEDEKAEIEKLDKMINGDRSENK